jgi:tRNA(Ile)-lysidine synthase
MRVNIDGKTMLAARGLELTVGVLDVDASTIAAHIHQLAGRGQTSYEEWIDADKVHPPLIARSRRPGDRFFPLGMTAMKKLSDFFIDEKIDAALRERTVVLCDQLGPVWIVPFRIDDRVRLTEATRRVLRLQARPTESGTG